MRAITYILICCAVGGYLASSVSDPDLWWHIVVGRWILANGDVPHQDYWNMFAAGNLWRAYSWSNEIVLALIDRIWGVIGLFYAQLALCILLLLGASLALGRVAKDRIFGLWLGVFAVTACYNHLTLRPQAVVWGIFAGLLMLANDQRKRWMLTALLGTAWANTHLSAVIGLVAVVLWGVGTTSLSNCLLMGGVFVAGTLLTPYFGGEWITLITKSGHPLSFREIAEFQPATIMQFPTVFVLLLIVTLIVLTYQSRKLPPIGPALVCGGLTLVGLSVVKFLPFAVIALAMLVARTWSERVREDLQPGLLDGLNRAREWCASLSQEVLSGVAFLALAISVVEIVPLTREPLAPTMVPKAALDFMYKNNLPRPWLNEFAFGGYLMYRDSDPYGITPNKVAIDGRTNVNPPEVWKSYLASLMGKQNWRDFINMVDAKTILWRNEGPFPVLLKESGEWCEVYADPEGAGNFRVFSPCT